MRDAQAQASISSNRSVTALVLLALTAAIPASARAESYPNRAVKIIVPFPAGGTADAIPRLVADWLSRRWAQPVIIENRTGAAGNIGAEFAYRSPPTATRCLHHHRRRL